MALERADHRLVRLAVDVLDYPAEVAHRLVVVDDEGERETLQAAVEACDRAPAVAALRDSLVCCAAGT
jgi:hypothetical protein